MLQFVAGGVQFVAHGLELRAAVLQGLLQLLDRLPRIGAAQFQLGHFLLQLLQTFLVQVGGQLAPFRLQALPAGLQAAGVVPQMAQTGALHFRLL
ncbi:hypothetical protein, partial [Methylogaea oryzae]|uniref:hypothetical protein n=1 Tax=Methylogaea oryzae TaxID=1295382 RepID=UPI0012E16CF9